MKVHDIVTQIIAALKGELHDGFGTVKMFAEEQSERLARFALVIAEERAFGSLKTNNTMFKRFTKRLEEQTEAFARHLVMLSVLTLEKAWNAIVGVVWGAINSILANTGLPIEMPDVPSV